MLLGFKNGEAIVDTKATWPEELALPLILVREADELSVRFWVTSSLGTHGIILGCHFWLDRAKSATESGRLAVRVMKYVWSIASSRIEE